MNFEDLIGTDALTPEDEARLRRVHDLLVQAGPPPDLTPALERPAALTAVDEPPEMGELVELPLFYRRRRAAAAVIAVAAALTLVAGGYVWGHSKASTAFVAQHTVPMHGASGALAVIRLGTADDVGNWPMQMEVSGLPEQADRASYYELWLTKDNKPIAPCGSFRVHGKTTRVRFTVPYALHGFNGWVVTAQPADLRMPGRVVLTTA